MESNQKVRVRNGRSLAYSSEVTKLPDSYPEFSKLFDWCEDNIGEFDQDWSTVYNKSGMTWDFARREDLVRFVLTFF